MASAAKLAMFPSAEALSAAEEYAQLSGEEIFAASQETSRIYNAQVLAKAVVITQTRLRCSSLRLLARMLGRGTTIVYRWAGGKNPIGDTAFLHAIRDLALIGEGFRT